MNNKKAFTLVELGVSIMILLVVSAIAVVSVRWYTTWARDAWRISDLSSIAQLLEVNQTVKNRVELPENSVNINFWWEQKFIQWDFSENVQKNFNLTTVFQDPKSEKFFTYSVSPDRRLYQISWILEREPISDENEKVNSTIFNYKNKGFFPYVAWKKVWAVLQSETLYGIHEKWWDFNLLSPTEAVIYIEENEEEIKVLSSSNTAEILLYLSSLKNHTTCKWMKDEFWINAVNGNYSLRVTSKTRQITFCDMSLY